MMLKIRMIRLERHRPESGQPPAEAGRSLDGLRHVGEGAAALVQRRVEVLDVAKCLFATASFASGQQELRPAAARGCRAAGTPARSRAAPPSRRWRADRIIQDQDHELALAGADLLGERRQHGAEQLGVDRAADEPTGTPWPGRRSRTGRAAGSGGGRPRPAADPWAPTADAGPASARAGARRRPRPRPRARGAPRDALAAR